MNLIKLVDLYHQSEDLLKDIPDCPRKEIISRIINLHPELQKIKYKAIISEILFGNREHLTNVFLSSDAIGDKIELFVLFRMTYQFKSLTLQDLRDEGIDLNENKLDNLKQEIEEIVDGWIRDGPISYLAETTDELYRDEYLKTEYDLIKRIWHTYALLSGSFEITFSEIEKIADLQSHLTRALREGGSISIAQLQRVVTSLRASIKKLSSQNIIDYLESTVNDVKTYVDNYLQNMDWSSQKIGEVFHSPFEAFTIQHLKSVDPSINLAHEKYTALPSRNFQVDSLIERDATFKDKIDKNQDVIQIPGRINMITIDYTFSSKKDIVLGKCDKSYQSDDRLLLIVLLGSKNPNTVQKLRENLADDTDIPEYSKGDKYVRIITMEEYTTFLTIEYYDFADTFNEIIELSYKIFRSQSLNFDRENIYGQLSKYWSLAVDYLAAYDDDAWVDKYLPQT
ncbi:MAG: hypothetical protein BAJALOKI3v1_1090003 [Promethearchaeota archaeon]|nr:MAG: hypothetical protein BAJALOKI3v1_1090003 [Candidatus Lokiarchaeota archaeon]